MGSNRIIISLLGFCILTLSGCSQEESEGSTPATGSKKLLLTSAVKQTRSLSQNIQSSQLSNGNKVGVYVIDEADAAVCDNVRITADGDGGFTYDQDLYWPAEGKASIYAYAPYQEEWKGRFVETDTFTVAADQTTDAGYMASDLIHGVPTNGNPMESTSSAVALAFQHLLVKININIVNNSNTELG